MNRSDLPGLMFATLVVVSICGLLLWGLRTYIRRDATSKKRPDEKRRGDRRHDAEWYERDD